jgi:hypothetical protein
VEGTEVSLLKEENSKGAIVQEGSQDREYIAQLFYLNQTTSTCEIHLVVTWNVEAQLTVSDPAHNMFCY